MILALVLLLMRISIGSSLLKKSLQRPNSLDYSRGLSSTWRVGGTTNRAAMTMVRGEFVDPGGVVNKRKFAMTPGFDVAAFSAPGDSFTMRFDGGSRGNPGVAGSGAVIYAPSGDEVWWGYKYVGSTNTNNQAEYAGLILGLQQAQALNINNLKIEGDSLLVISQLCGEWKVKNEGLKSYHKEASALARSISVWSARHIPRGENGRADQLSNDAMDSRDCSSHINTALWPQHERPIMDMEEALDGDIAAKRARARIEIDLSGEKAIGGSPSEGTATKVAFMESTEGLLSVVTLVESDAAGVASGGGGVAGKLFFLLAKTSSDELSASIQLELPAVPRGCSTPFKCVEDCFTSDMDAEYSNTSSDVASRTAAGTLRMLCPSTWPVFDFAVKNGSYLWFSTPGAQDPTPAMGSLAQAIYGANIFTGRQVELVVVPASELGEYVQHCQDRHDWRISAGLEALAASTRLGVGE